MGISISAADADPADAARRLHVSDWIQNRLWALQSAQPDRDVDETHQPALWFFTMPSPVW
jgi:hypothetical protein